MLHHLPARPDTILWGHLDPNAAPVLRITPGDSVEVETLSGGARNLPAEGQPGTALPSHLAVIAAKSPELGPHMLTGPIHIEGAEPGDRLIVEIGEIRFAQDYGWNAIEPGFGMFPDLAESYQNLTIAIDRARGVAQLPWGPEAALAPFFGILAVAPPVAGGRLSSVPPGAFGGNIDNPFARAGAVISLPVFVPGALFMAGDGHALQGDGEICDTALETALNARFRFTLEKGTAPPAPEILYQNRLITMGFNPDLNRAAEEAAARMIEAICARSPLSRAEAFRHCSLFGSLRITQVVNGVKGVHCVLDLGSLKGADPA